MRSDTLRERLVLAALVVTAAVVFTRGIRWGLPSRDVDRYLFGDREPWTGEHILALTGGRSHDAHRGADVDINPLRKSGSPLLLNATNTQRAEILTRYRLYTYQPDEMITMMALANMKPSALQLDPKLYQYGGLWIYPIGLLLKGASMAGYVTLRPDPAYYLDHPDAFARFYIVARTYTAIWGMIGAIAVHWLARRLTGDAMLIPAAATLVYVFMPIVIDMTHEAKPHLPAAVLMLVAVIAAVRYVDTGQRAWWMTAGLLCGAAFGMVLSALPTFIILPIMTMFRPQSLRHRVQIALFAAAFGLAVYFLTNPYVLINAFINREVLHSNFGNSLAMYELGRWREGLFNAIHLISKGSSSLLAIVGGIASLVLLTRAPIVLNGRGTVSNNPTVHMPTTAAAIQSAASNRPVFFLLLAPAAVITLQFVALAAGKPAEYGRFAVLPDVILGLLAVCLIASTYKAQWLRSILLILVIVATVYEGRPCLKAFERDASGENSRMQAARELRYRCDRGMRRLAVVAEPAPYNMPPFDLFRWELWLCPKFWNINNPPNPEIAAWPEQGSYPPFAGIEPSRPGAMDTISWAARPILLWTREEAPASAASSEPAVMRNASP